MAEKFIKYSASYPADIYNSLLFEKIYGNAGTT